MLLLVSYWITLIIRSLGVFVSKVLTTDCNALHLLYILEIVKILQDSVCHRTCFQSISRESSRHSPEYYNQYTPVF